MILKEALAVSAPQVINDLIKVITFYVMEAMMVLYYAGVLILQQNEILQPKQEAPMHAPVGEEEIFSDMFANIVDKMHNKDRKVNPFTHHMSKYFVEGEPLTRTEVIENMYLSLESLGEELEAASPGSKVESDVKRVDEEDAIMLYGHLTWKVDNATPEVYDITMDLLKDGFVFRADSKSFVITSRVPK